MLSTDIHLDLAHQLHAAEKAREQILAPSLQHPDITIEDAYAVQKTWVGLKLAEGRVIKGHKIGLTSRAMQQSSQIDEPDYGTLMDDMFFHDGADIPAGRFIAPMVEVELAFVLKAPLKGPDVTVEQVLAATEGLDGFVGQRLGEHPVWQAETAADAGGLGLGDVTAERGEAFLEAAVLGDGLVADLVGDALVGRF